MSKTPNAKPRQKKKKKAQNTSRQLIFKMNPVIFFFYKKILWRVVLWLTICVQISKVPCSSPAGSKV